MTVTPQVRKLETSANYGKFDIEPLDPGFGTTLGNTLRRVLLSSLWGAAVTSIQIDGVAHEFTAIPHVKEDVTEVILNLKRLCLKSFTEDPVTLILDVKGPAEVHASHIQASSDVEIVNPDLYICTLAAKGHLRMELNVDRGNGHAAELFTQHVSLSARFRDSIEKHEAELRGEKGSQNRLMDTPIEELDLSVRAFNCLKANEIQTVGQLLQKREEELLALRNFGRKSLDEIKEKLVEKGFIKPEEMGTVLRG